MKVLGTQLAGVARRPARLLLTGLAVLVASFVVYATVLARDITEKTVLDGLSGTPAAVDLVVGSQEGSAELHAPELAKIKAVPGVAEAIGGLTAYAQVGTNSQQYLDVAADPGSGPLSQVTVSKGSYPSKPGQIAVTQRTADRMGLPLGSTVSLASQFDDKGKPLHPVQMTVTALVEAKEDFGTNAYASQPVVSKLNGGDQLDRIEVRLQPGADAGAVTAAVQQIIHAAPATPETVLPQVFTGEEQRSFEAHRAASDVDVLFAVVGVFVAVAVFAAGLVAASTFRIVFAQRMRQLALLRTIGAGRGALWRALAVEGALTGLAAGLAGVLLAIAAGLALPPLLRSGGVHLASPTISLLPLLGVLLLAVVVTVVAVLSPAFSAARVAPLEALRAAGATQGKRGIGVVRGVFGGLVALGAAGLAGYVLTNLPERGAANDNLQDLLTAVVASAALAFVALIVLGPLVVRPVLAGVAVALRGLGPVGRLAVGGVGGATRRAAAVSVVVALGVALISGVVVGGASVRVVAQRDLATSSPADFELTTQGDERIPAQLLERARQSTDLTHATGYRKQQVTLGASEDSYTVTDLSLTTLPALEQLDVKDGSLAALGPGKAVVSGWLSEVNHLNVGDTVTMLNGKKKASVEVVAVLPDSAPLQAAMVLDPAQLTALGTPATLDGILADSAKSGEDGRTAAQQAMTQLMQGSTGLGLTPLADARDETNKVITGVLAVALGLVGLTVLIAVVGVGTTVALSVVERVREAGLLRAVGLSRAGLRSMLTTESALYGVLGAVLGLLLGVPYAWLAIRTLNLQAPFAFPLWQLALVFLALVALTLLAGVLPARKAAKVSPVVALSAE
ncbi:ABC transporter permease [Actinoplanes sp. TFC3]|uniref:ABC transporter permease n=1 Tax=Actinoplanes sp. TFC3 TaxID=1710355 RepID=UPI000830B860|nr:ABC transporter permease [Actinoplanes sp. TFC3]